MIIKRRLLFWLLKAYIKKWGKVFFLFFLLGLLCFFVILFSFNNVVTTLFPPRPRSIGIVGSYTITNLPESILANVSHGLTKINKDGTASPDLAASWEVQDSGKTYIFHLRPNTRFTDRSVFTSQDITYSFSNVDVQRPDANTIIFHLKEVYAPFLTSVSHPLFKDGFTGIGTTKIRNIKLNAGYVESLTLFQENGTAEKTYAFYPTQESVKIAFALGDISEIDTISDISLPHTSFTAFPNASITSRTDYTQLVTVFYNTEDKALNDKRLRDALSYALPSTFPHSIRAHSPLLPTSWAYQEDTLHVFDATHAKLLLEAAGYSSKNPVPTMIIAALPEYIQTAKSIAASWKTIGITTKIVPVQERPDTFQIFLGNFRPPRDPDQYTLWHSGAENNITNYKNLRIDTLLENGRKTIDQDARIKIYADFQKYLMDDAPASFLYFPVTYTIKRK